MADGLMSKPRKLYRSLARRKSVRGGLLLLGLLGTCVWWLLHWHSLRRRARMSCYEIAERTTEPYTQDYEFKEEGVEVNGTIWADYRWEGDITRDMFINMREEMSMEMEHLVIVDNKLYQQISSRKAWEVHNHGWHRRLHLMNLIHTALAMFKIPDVEFVLDFQDHPTNAGPMIHMSLKTDYDKKQAGFTMPGDEVFRTALGPRQMSVYQECLRERYPFGKNRIPKAVWRGSWWQVHWSKIRRFRFVELASQATNITDVYFTRTMACGTPSCMSDVWREDGFQIEFKESETPKFPVGSRIDFEDFNKYDLVLDVDGIGWSGRFSQLLQGNTPIAKQDTRYREHLWSHVLVSNVVTFFNHELSDFLHVVDQELKERNISKQEEMIDRMHNFSASHLTQYALARATAYALTMYAESMKWKPELDQNHERSYLYPKLLPPLPRKLRSKLINQSKCDYRKFNTSD